MLKFRVMRLCKFLAAKKDWLALIFLLAIFLALKISVIAPHFADGWIYFYFGKLVAAGDVPYRDFYYSSPPLIPYLMGFLHSLFGFKLSFANLLPVLFSTLDAIFIFIFLRKKISANLALLAVFAYLFSLLNFATTDYFSEAHPLTTFALLGLLLFENRKLFWSGIFFGLAGLTKLYGILPAVFLPILLFREPKNLTRFLSGIFLSFGIPNLIFFLLVGREYLEMVFLNHLQKGEGIPKGRIFTFFLTKDFWLLLSAAPLLFAKKLKTILVPFLGILALVIFYIFFKDIYYLYFKIFVGFFVILLVLVLNGSPNIWRVDAKEFATKLIVILILTNSLFALQHYFTTQTKKARIENLTEIVAEVQKNEGEIYGDFEIAPLVALLADKNIFQNYVDTNEKFLNLGIVNSEERARELEESGVKIVLTKNLVSDDIYGLETLLPREFFSQNCVVQRTFPLRDDYVDNAVIVWKCGVSDE